MPAVELVRTTLPPSPRSTIDGSAARVVLKTPVRLMSIISCHCCSVISQATAQDPMPALAQTMSILPSSARPASTALLHLRQRAHVGDGLDRSAVRGLDLLDGRVEIVLGRQAVRDRLDGVGADVDRDYVGALLREPHRVRAPLSRPAPVTSATFPSTSPISNQLLPRLSRCTLREVTLGPPYHMK